MEDDLKDQEEHLTNLLSAAWDRFEMAETFLTKAREAQTGAHDIRPRWCIYAATGAAWSAIDIYRRLAELLFSGKRGKTDRWFDENNLSLIQEIRNGFVHSVFEHGIGATIRPGGSEPQVTFFWMRDESGARKHMPVDDVLAELAKAIERLKVFMFESSGQRYLGFNP